MVRDDRSKDVDRCSSSGDPQLRDVDQRRTDDRRGTVPIAPHHAAVAPFHVSRLGECRRHRPHVIAMGAQAFRHLLRQRRGLIVQVHASPREPCRYPFCAHRDPHVRYGTELPTAFPSAGQWTDPGLRSARIRRSKGALSSCLEDSSPTLDRRDGRPIPASIRSIENRSQPTTCPMSAPPASRQRSVASTARTLPAPSDPHPDGTNPHGTDDLTGPGIDADLPS